MPEEDKKSWWERWRDVIYIALFVAIIILILVLFDANYRINVVLGYLWNDTCPQAMTFR